MESSDGKPTVQVTRRGAWRRPNPGAWLPALWARIKGMTIWEWAITAVVIFYTWHLTQLTLDIHYGLGSYTFDFALYDQGVWLMSRFKAPFVTLMGRNLLGDHTSFILVFLVPVYWVFPGAGVLLFTQSLAAAVSSIPVFLYARLRLGNEALAFLLASLYLLHPALLGTNLENFHPDMYLTPLLMFAIYGALTERWRLYVTCVMLSLLVKEDVSLVIIPLGIWVALRKDRMIGLATIGASVAYAFFVVMVIMRGLVGSTAPNAWRIPFGGVIGFLTEIVNRPGNVVDYLRADGRPWYLWQMLTPFAWLMVRLPEVALISGLVLTTNVISNFAYQHQVIYHYSAIALPALALGTVYALGAFKGRGRAIAVSALVVTSLWSAYLWAPLFPGRSQPARWGEDFPVPVAAQEIIEGIPDDAVVSAYHLVTPHLARREQIYMWPNPFVRVMYGSDISLEGTRMPEADDIEYVVLLKNRPPEDEERWEAVADDFALVRANEFWELYQRIPSG